MISEVQVRDFLLYRYYGDSGGKHNLSGLIKHEKHENSLRFPFRALTHSMPGNKLCNVEVSSKVYVLIKVVNNT